MDSRHSLGKMDDVSDVGNGHFVRPIYDLQPSSDQGGNTPVSPGADTAIIGSMWWHDCGGGGGHWLIANNASPILECPVCGDRGSVVDGRWTKNPS
jgi:hypothetical protein